MPYLYHFSLSLFNYVVLSSYLIKIFLSSQGLISILIANRLCFMHFHLFFLASLSNY